MRKILYVAVLALLIGLPAWAQEEGEREAREAVAEAAGEATEGATEGAAGEAGEESRGGVQLDPESRRQMREELLRAIRLPRAAEEARATGVPVEEVKKVLEAAKKQDLPAGETGAIIEEETRAVKEKGPIDNFGAFVKSKLDQGLRGRELAEAIHAEHAARGRGKGKGKIRTQDVGRAAELGEEEVGQGRENRGKGKDKAKLREKLEGEKKKFEKEMDEGEEEARDEAKSKKDKGKQKGNEAKKKGKDSPDRDNR